MNKIEFNSFEEKLYIACGTSDRIAKFRRQTLLSGLLFCALFAGLGATMPPFQYWIGIILGAYALVNWLEIDRFGRVLASYRSILYKLGTRLFERTKQPEYEALMQEASCARIEKRLIWNIRLLTVFFLLFLAAAFVLEMPHRNGMVSGGTILLILLSIRLKFAVANTITAYKKAAFENGRTLNAMPVEP